MRSIFTLDDYCGDIMISRDFVGVLLNQFEDYNNWARENGLHYWRLSQLIGKIREWQSWGYTENNAIIMAMRGYFQCRNVKEIKLSKPVYSRQLYKKYDLIQDKLLSRSSMHGMTYTEMNRKVAEFNW